MAVAVMAVAFAPTALHGQTVRDRPFGEIRTQILGGSQIGASLRDVQPADVAREKLNDQAGAVVEEVDRDGPAALAGFRAGDIVVTFDGERIRSARHLARLIEETPDGRSVSVSVVRAARPMDLQVTPQASRPFSAFQGLRELVFAWPGVLGERRSARPEDFELRQTRPGLLNTRRGQLGVTVQELSAQLADYFGASSGGALVSNVAPDSPAAEAGIKAGDVITRVNDRPVSSASDVTRLLQAGPADATITILRDRKEQTLKATIDPVEGRAPRRIIR
jgi:S1-C subfamily serine protease